MFENVLEKELRRKVQIINNLWQNNTLTSSKLAQIIGVTATTIKADVKTINFCYSEKKCPLICSEKRGYFISNKENRNKRMYLSQIYNESLFLRACYFFLTNNFSNVLKFSEKEFISVTKAYELKARVVSYVEKLDIKVSNLSASNNECKIRFLITLLAIKLGFDGNLITKNTKNRFTELFSELEQSEGCLFSNYSKEYASILFQLNFNRRKNNPVVFDQFLANILIKSPLYQRLVPKILAFLDRELHNNYTEDEVYYYFLIFNVMNANYYSMDIYNNYVDIIIKSPYLKYQKLIELFELEFQISLKNVELFEATLTTFIRKCSCNLQIFIPEEHVELGNSVKVLDDYFLRVKNVLYQWNQLTNLNLVFSDNHIQYLSSKLFFIGNKKRCPQNVFFLTSFFADYLLAKTIFEREFKGFVSFQRFDPNKEIHEYSDKDLILYDTLYDGLSKINCQKMKISYIFDLAELQRIRSMLYKTDFEGILKTDYE